MAQLPQYPDGTDPDADQETEQRMPRWKPALGIVVASVVIIVVIYAHLAGIVGAGAH